MNERNRPPLVETVRRLRIREWSAVALLWIVLMSIAVPPSIGTATGAVLVGLAASIPLSAPLRTVDSSVINVATARRVALATLVAATIAGVWWIEFWSSHPFIWFLGVSATWIEVAVSTRIKPLATRTRSGSAPSPFTLPTPSLPLASRASKRVVDIVVSSTLILVVSPGLVAISMAIHRSDGGPAFFRQRRLAQDGGTFQMLKFRSMVIHAEQLRHQLDASNQRNGPLFKMSRDPRITPIGRILRNLSLDELPQLFNILRGDMSLVGPRPALPSEAAHFDRQLARRVLVKPGLTGLWQAEARSDPDFARFRELDLRYLETCSPLLDFWILLATASEVITAAAMIPLRLFGLDVRPVDGIMDAVPEGAASSSR